LRIVDFFSLKIREQRVIG